MLILDIAMRPFSINSDKGIAIIKGRPIIIKSKNSREDRRELQVRLLKYTIPLKNLLKDFDPKLHYFWIKFFWLYDSKEYFTKAGTKSQRLVDIDNACKSFQDEIFKVIGIGDHVVAHSEALCLPADKTKCVIHIGYKEWKELL